MPLVAVYVLIVLLAYASYGAGRFLRVSDDLHKLADAFNRGVEVGQRLAHNLPSDDSRREEG
jgi:hypothetical protein